MPNPEVISAGGLVCRTTEVSIEVVLVGSGSPVQWRIPKGMQIEGESIEETAIREVREESGVTGTVIRLIDTGKWTYQYEGQLWDETCFFFLFEYADGNTDKHDDEYELVQWVDIHKAAIMLYYKIEQDIVYKLIQESTINS